MNDPVSRALSAAFTALALLERPDVDDTTVREFYDVLRALLEWEARTTKEEES